MNGVQIADVKIEPSWKAALAYEFDQPYFAQIKEQLLAAKNAGKTVYPRGSLIFNAFNTTPLSEVKVVILGQDRTISRIKQWVYLFLYRMAWRFRRLYAMCIKSWRARLRVLPFRITAI